MEEPNVAQAFGRFTASQSRPDTEDFVEDFPAHFSLSYFSLAIDSALW
jgi:hypothetical protein